MGEDWFCSGIYVTSVVLTETTISLVGEEDSEQLVATVYPTNACDTSVEWSSSNESVATVSSTGLVTPVADGSATITVTTNDGEFTDTVTVNVTGFLNAPEQDDILARYNFAGSVSAGEAVQTFTGISTGAVTNSGGTAVFTGVQSLEVDLSSATFEDLTDPIEIRFYFYNSLYNAFARYTWLDNIRVLSGE